MRLIDALLDYTTKNISLLPDKYSWKINYEYLPVSIVRHPNENLYLQNKKLRSCLSQRFSSCNDNEKIDIITWYISNWGGIKTNGTEVIKKYALSNEDDIIARKAKGISSWSKALSIRDPQKFSIYDARVASALNSLQIIYDVDDKIYFPHLSSRNTDIIRSNEMRKSLKTIWQNGAKIDFYRHYLEILDKLVEKIGNGIDAHDIEMLLFANAVELTKKFKNPEKKT